MYVICLLIMVQWGTTCYTFPSVSVGFSVVWLYVLIYGVIVHLGFFTYVSLKNMCAHKLT